MKMGIKCLVYLFVIYGSFKCAEVKKGIGGTYKLIEGKAFCKDCNDEYLCLLNDSVFVFCGRIENCWEDENYVCHSFTKGKWRVSSDTVLLNTSDYEKGGLRGDISSYLETVFPKDTAQEQIIYVIGGDLGLKIIKDSKLKLKNSVYAKE